MRRPTRSRPSTSACARSHRADGVTPVAEGRRLMEALFRAPARAGRGGPGWLTGAARHALTGSEVRWHWRVEQGHIAVARFEVRGCPDVIAATELAAAVLEGQPAAAPAVDIRSIATRLAAPAEKLGTLLVIDDAIAATAIQFRARQP